jgi:hypothetical protein
MAATAQELLDLVNDAIKARLEGGLVTAYTINGRNLQRDPLDKIIALRDDLKAEVAGAAGGRNLVELDRAT